MSTALERLLARRATWRGGRVTTFEEQDTLRRTFWRDVDGGTRLDAVVAMAVESEVLKGHEPPTGFRRSLGGVRRRGR